MVQQVIQYSSIARTEDSSHNFREKNEDKKTNIDATTMTGRGECKAFRTNYGGEYQYIFAERRNDDYSCHHCVHFFVRTVNIIEKKESKSRYLYFLDYCHLIHVSRWLYSAPTKPEVMGEHL